MPLPRAVRAALAVTLLATAPVAARDAASCREDGLTAEAFATDRDKGAAADLRRLVGGIAAELEGEGRREDARVLRQILDLALAPAFAGMSPGAVGGAVARLCMERGGRDYGHGGARGGRSR